jgi:polar amino acid transport system substrate-binding protein
MRAGAVLASSLLLLVAGCGLPKDPDGTLEKVSGGELRVGVVPGNERAAAEDGRIVDALAQALRSRPVFQHADAHHLFHELEEGRLDLIVGGLPTDTPFFDKAGLTRKAGPLMQPGSTQDRVLAVPAGENGFLIAVNRAIEQAKSGADR